MRRALVSSGPLLCALVAIACSTGDAASPPGPSSQTSEAGPDAAAGPVDATAIEDVAWDHVRTPYDGAATSGPARVPVHADLVTTRVDTQQLMFAAGEMQISGEPFAETFAGRNLADYDRTYLPPNQYILHNGSDDALPITDLFGFSTAVESYEYSKYHMNMVAEMTSAGISLANGPIVAKEQGATTVAKLAARAQRIYVASSADIYGIALVPAPANNALNPLGFQGMWPNMFPFASFDPAMDPDNGAAKSCNLRTGYGGIPQGNGVGVPAYECAYNTLALTNRDAQVDKTLIPAVVGFATWKEALWSIDFVSRLHDGYSNPVNAVADADRPLVGTKNNQVLATDPPGASAGTYIGSTPLEGTWGMMMCTEMDNAAAFLVKSFTTGDGSTLGGFPTYADAIAYDYGSPLRWFPAAVKATEDATTPFPGIASLAITDATSRSIDLSAVLLGHAMFFGMTDARNVAVGQQVGLAVAFDGDPFAADDGAPDGEDSPHDHALAVIRVAFVDLDRMHTVAVTQPVATSVTADSATVSGATVTPGSTVTTTNLAHVEIALRQALSSLNATISQYGAPDPDPAKDVDGILNTPPIHPTAPGAGTTMSPRIRQLFTANAIFVRDVLTKADGSVANGATIANGVATPAAGAATIESQGAAVRALTEAFLVTGDESFRARARLVAARLLGSTFYSAPARMFRGVESGDDAIDVTAERFAWLQSALRETHKTLHVEGDPALGRDVLEDRIARVNKLYLNGWDDLDGNGAIDKATECLAARMQLAEQSLTGELGRDDNGDPTSDRDGDCILEVDDAKVGSVLAGDVKFHAP